MKKIIVLGSNFAGVTAALEAKRKIGKEAEIVVISPSKNFLYVPSLIWVPFGRRAVKDITFDIRPVLEKKGIGFLHDAAVEVEPDENLVYTKNNGEIAYDYLIVTTGVGMKFHILPNLNPDHGYVETIVTPRYAEKAAQAFEDLVADPGPVVVGATQAASCMGAGYEYLFNLDKELRRRNVRKQVELTWITPEPFLGHFGIGGVTGGKLM
ncbi:MAG: FAD-dependent oxidoreductase, partial [Bacteroidota bacterium]